jgi:uncharacterized protein (TIGR04255 family)
MAKKVPKRLGKEPLIESVFEVRFSSEVSSVSSVMPGILFSAYANRVAKTVPLPLAGVIPQIRESDPNLKYAPVVQVSLDPGPYLIQIGDHVASLSCPRPYTGWSEFWRVIREFVAVLKSSTLISRPERFSMKYADVLSLAGAPTVAVLDVEFKLGGRDATSGPVVLRSEEQDGPFVHLVHIASSVNAQLPSGDQLSGILIENDTIYNHSSGDFWEILERQLEPMHQINKDRFFALLKPDTLAALEPEY